MGSTRGKNLHTPPRFTIRPVGLDELDGLLCVYRQCEDFLALGPVGTASPEMVRADMALSSAAGGLYCGIFLHEPDLPPILAGVLDYIPSGYEHNPHHAYLELLMIAAPYRSQGLGAAVVNWLEECLRKDGQARCLLAGVQVNNPRAVSFWERQGFRRVSGPTPMTDGTTVSELQKEL